jgi:hypothetical protein
MSDLLMTRSKVKAEQVAEVEAGIKRLVPALQQAQLEDIRYAWFRLADGVTYVVLVEYEGGGNPAANLPEYQAFMEILKASIDVPPTTEPLTVSGSYRFF